MNPEMQVKTHRHQLKVRHHSSNMESTKIETSLGNMQIIDALKQVYGDIAPKKSTTYKWISRFRSGKTKVEMSPAVTSPAMSDFEENIDAVRDSIENDRRITTGSVVDTLNTPWVLHTQFLWRDDPEVKIQSKQWLPRGRSGPVKAESERSRGKREVTVFWDAEGVLLVDFLENKTITSNYC
nr:uncharacterized protein LOC113799961 [Penaeus vannamei]